jgi:peptidyl-prolyl cis-trans isomerase B (cyclophilin B)
VYFSKPLSAATKGNFMKLKSVLPYTLGILLFCLSGTFAMAQDKDPNELYAVIETSRGTMEFLLYRQVAPLAVSNFVNLATRGYYDGMTFHRVVADFMVQGGDPAGDGSGGPGYRFKDEIALRMNQEGILAMANSGPDSNGSQFFITHQATPHLNGVHTVFGLVITGKDVIRKIRIGDVIRSISIEGNAKALLDRNSSMVYQWNQVLDSNFPNLKQALID